MEKKNMKYNNKIFDMMSDLLTELLKIKDINEEYPKLKEGYYACAKIEDKMIYIKLKMKEVKLNVSE